MNKIVLDSRIWKECLTASRKTVTRLRKQYIKSVQRQRIKARHEYDVIRFHKHIRWLKFWSNHKTTPTIYSTIKGLDEDTRKKFVKEEITLVPTIKQIRDYWYHGFASPEYYDKLIKYIDAQLEIVEQSASTILFLKTDDFGMTVIRLACEKGIISKVEVNKNEVR